LSPSTAATTRRLSDERRDLLIGDLADLLVRNRTPDRRSASHGEELPAIQTERVVSVVVRMLFGGNADVGALGQDDHRAMQTTGPYRSRLIPFVHATVAEVMTKTLISCTPDTPLRSVARLMTEHRVHSVFVLDYGQEEHETVELWGLVSDLDLVAAAWADLDGQTAGDTAVTPLVYVSTDDDLRHAAQLMAETGVSHLTVIDPLTRRPAGVISTLDIATEISR
jgi:CBS domain-containing protein